MTGGIDKIKKDICLNSKGCEYQCNKSVNINDTYKGLCRQGKNILEQFLLIITIGIELKISHAITQILYSIFVVVYCLCWPKDCIIGTRRVG